MEFHPIAAEYDLMEPEELAWIIDSMKEFGYDPHFPIWLHEGKILDGRNRFNSAEAAGVEPAYENYKGTDEQARRFVVTANENRRHLKAEWLKKKRKARQARVAEARTAGQSIRAIAETEQISTAQVQRDLEEVSTVTPHVTVEPADGKVTGLDGRTRTSTVTQATTNGKHTPKEEPPPLTDSLDVEVPAGLVPVFEKVGEFKGIVNQLNTINRTLKELAAHPAGASLRLQPAQIDLKNLKETVRFDMPYAVCPACKGLPKSRKANCPCKDRGWLIEGAYKNLPTELRQ